MRSDQSFSGAYGGDNNKISDNSRLECKICRYVYDPALGDDYWHVPAGTPSSALPGHWTCPQCDGMKNNFLIIEPTP